MERKEFLITEKVAEQYKIKDYDKHELVHGITVNDARDIIGAYENGGIYNVDEPAVIEGIKEEFISNDEIGRVIHDVTAHALENVCEGEDNRSLSHTNLVNYDRISRIYAEKYPDDDIVNPVVINRKVNEINKILTDLGITDFVNSLTERSFIEIHEETNNTGDISDTMNPVLANVMTGIIDSFDLPNEKVRRILNIKTEVDDDNDEACYGIAMAGTYEFDALRPVINNKTKGEDDNE